MVSRSSSLFLFLFFLFNLAGAKLILEDGYEVTTVVDGRKLHVNPRAVQAQPGSSDLIVLDSHGSTFYTVSFPLSGESVVKRIAGDGTWGDSDGEAGEASFGKPQSFTIDAKGNVYVADKHNNAIRKISHSGTVTTIAGGISKAEGHRDGPAQNATFSNDFEISFIPQGCCLLVSDHGTQLIRQINLKKEDCTISSHSNLGTATVWSIGLLLSCLLGLVIGIVVRPYVIPHEGTNRLSLIVTWKHYLVNLGKLVTLFSDIRNGAAKFRVYSVLSRLVRLILSHLSLMFRLSNVNYSIPPNKAVSLLGSDDPSCSKVMPSEKISYDMKDLISFDDAPELSNWRNNETKEDEECSAEEKSNVSSHPHGKIDRIIEAHVEGFSKMAEENDVVLGSSFGNSGLVKRRWK